jgi:hypothetical protein
MKKLLLILTAVVLGVTSPVHAETTQNLVINGEVVAKVVAQMTFEGDNVLLTFSDGTSRTDDMSTVKLSFVSPTSIQKLTTYHLRGVVDDVLSFEGLENGTEISIFDASGKQMLRSKEKTVNVHALKAGIYVLKAGNQIVKFVKH